jgi:hypothetical protein
MTVGHSFDLRTPYNPSRVMLRRILVWIAGASLLAAVLGAETPLGRGPAGTTGLVSQQAGGSRRRSAASTAGTSRLRLGSEMSRIEIETTDVSFGSSNGDGPKEYPSAIVVRVFSQRSWALRLIPVGPMAEERGKVIDWSRMEWRSRGTVYQPVLAQGVVVARGQATGENGQLVSIDLRLAFTDVDPLGRYRCTLQVGLDAL